MESLHAQLLALQELDDEIAAAEAKLEAFEPRFRELEEPAVALEAEVAAARERLEKLHKDARKLDHGATQKRERLRTYEERLQRSRTPRDDSTARTELDLIRSAVAADEADAREIAAQTTRTDLRIDELEKSLERKRGELAPEREALEAERGAAASELAVLQEKRTNMTVRMDAPTLRLYERVRSGRTRRALAPLTDEGACGQCFNLLPVQEQSVVRGGDVLHRCEACGVILYAP